MLEHTAIPSVKVCGLTNLEDAQHAERVGAEGLGFVFHPASPRCADARRVRDISAQLAPATMTVAVVVDATPESAAELLQQTGLKAVQLCGAQQPDDWKHFEFPILRRLGVDEGAALEARSWNGIADVFLLDHPSSAGGSGREVDAQLATALCDEFPCLLAGGLDAERVVNAIRCVRPAGVDASSRLEREAGIKDPAAVAAFVQRALETLSEPES